MERRRILVIRLSAMGDVALTVPSVAAAASECDVVLVTKAPFHKFFGNIAGVSAVVADTNGRHRGVTGLLRLIRELGREGSFDAVIDLHDVIRSRFISLIFRLRGVPVFRIRKGRSEKRQFISDPSQAPLKHTTERYRETFAMAAVVWLPGKEEGFRVSDDEAEAAGSYLVRSGFRKGDRLVGIAPFARHLTKQWPLSHTRELMELLIKEGGKSVLLFGGPDEEAALEVLARDLGDRVKVVSGLGLRGDIALLSRMEFVITMDSSNLHMAALAGVSTVSIWGGTHPGTGFAPYGSQEHLLIEVSPSELDCRPCTVYGAGGCSRKDTRYRCLHDISPQRVYEALLKKGLVTLTEEV